MKILMINTEYERGGAAIVANMLHSNLNALPAYESLFAYGRGPQNQDFDAIRFALQSEVCFHVLITRFSGIQGYGTMFSTRRLLRLIREWKPDVIHFHNIHGYYLDLSVASAVDKLKIPVIWTLHDGWPLTGRCAGLHECIKWQTGCGSCPIHKAYPATYFDTSAVMWKKKRSLLGGVWNPVLVSPSKWLGGLLSDSCSGRCRVDVIPNGVDTRIFEMHDRLKSREKLDLPRDKKIILFTAADLKFKNKGAKYFFESLNFIDAEDCIVVTVGKKADISQISGARIPIKQLGYIEDRGVMVDIYSAADLFCMTSLEENFPTVVLEAMSCGLPVIAFDVGGIAEQLSEGCGWVVPTKDINALGEGINKLLKENDFRKRIGEKARKKVLAEYSKELFVRRYLELYEEMSKGEGRKGA